VRAAFWVIVGVMLHAVGRMCWELSESWIHEGQGLHPFLAGAMIVLLVGCVIALSRMTED